MAQCQIKTSKSDRFNIKVGQWHDPSFHNPSSVTNVKTFFFLWELCHCIFSPQDF